MIGPVALASAGLYYLQRGAWPLGRTLNNEVRLGRGSSRRLVAQERQTPAGLGLFCWTLRVQFECHTHTATAVAVVPCTSSLHYGS